MAYLILLSMQYAFSTWLQLLLTNIIPCDFMIFSTPTRIFVVIL
nr:MAG TPA: hypothetical protein [Caudoviricetes sp.]